jgi:hypothetical protein
MASTGSRLAILLLMTFTLLGQEKKLFPLVQRNPEEFFRGI